MESTWIDINDRMPNVEKKYGHEVLCYWVNRRDGNKTFRSVGLVYYKGGAFYRNYVGGNVISEPTHWMPIPKLPKIKKQPTPSQTKS